MDDRASKFEAALITIAHALGMDDTQAWENPLAFGVRAASKIYELRGVRPMDALREEKAS